MSTIKIELFKDIGFWTNVYVDGALVGQLEDSDNTVEATLRNLINIIPIENVELIVLKEKK